MDLKKFLTEEGVGFHMSDDGETIIMDCGGCDFEFLRIIKLLTEHIGEWTYEELKALKIDIDTTYEKIMISGEI